MPSPRSLWCSLLSSIAISLVATNVAVASETAIDQLFKASCLECHAGSSPDGSFSIEPLLVQAKLLAQTTPWKESLLDTQPWERILRKLRAGQMPPPPHEKPSLELLQAASKEMERGLKLHNDAFPSVARTPGLRRLTRTEYQNAIRDLLGIPIDATDLLPKDESSQGFDNITVGEWSPAYVSRAIKAAQYVSRQALGIQELGPAGVTVRIPPDRSQESHVAGLPLGTRGGTQFEYVFPQTGIYEFQVRLTRDRDEKVEGLTESTDLDVLIDRAPVHRFVIEKSSQPDDHTLVDANLRKRISVLAGVHVVGATFPQKSGSLQEIKRQPFDAAYNRHRHPRLHPAIYEISIVGPLDAATDDIPDTSIARKLFAGAPRNPPAAEQEQVAEGIVRRLTRLAYRRAVTEEDLLEPMQRYKQATQERGFQAGLEAALASILVNPNFLLRVESSPTDESELKSSSLIPVSEWELASRLSFFLWSSIPDEELLGLADRNQLSKPEVMVSQVDRMLRDPRADALVTNFASQWLHLRNLSSISPDLRLYPDFDDNLRMAMREETEFLLREVIQKNRSVIRLIQSDHSYLNERLATHYGIPGVLGSEMRRVDNVGAYHRGGILRHGSILSVTSYATRTSPTIRGSWILENIVGTPPPPPPPNIPALRERSPSRPTSTRELLALHRENPACASCHNLIDPVGFVLESYDALGRWRHWEGDSAIDSSTVLPDGRTATAVTDLEASILERPDAFVGTLVEKLLTYGLGRGAEVEDGPYVREIVRKSAESDYRFRAIIQAITQSRPFLMRHRD
ncbi:DUF1592 domain-containing protein [Pirellulaceae bacterium SH501]